MEFTDMTESNSFVPYPLAPKRHCEDAGGGITSARAPLIDCFVDF